MLLNIKVFPGAKNQEVKKQESLLGDLWKVYLKSKPEKGKANKELIDFLSEKFKVSKSEIVILKGKTSRNKIIKIGD